MEQVPSSHDGISCSGCSVNPIKGARFKCKICDHFDYCENCFYTKKGHRHAFSRIVEVGATESYAGKPGRYYRSEAYDTEGLVITEWNRCVQNLTVSSQDHVYKCELPNGVWQSCGSQGQVHCIISLVGTCIMLFYSIGFVLKCNLIL